MNDENPQVEKVTVTETVEDQPKVDEAGPLGNVTEALTGNPEPTPTVVERETVVETTAGEDDDS